MKKFLILPIVVFLMVLCFGQQTKATKAHESLAETTTANVSRKEEKAAPKYVYENLMDISKLSYDAEYDIYSYNIPITVEKDKTYSFIATDEFFGKYVKTPSLILAKTFKITFTSKTTNKATQMKVEIFPAHLDFLIGEFTVPDDGTIVVDDLVTRELPQNSPYLNEIILIYGHEFYFNGFRIYADKTGYSRADDPINIYTSIENPIDTTDITNNLKAYDPQTGFLDQSKIEILDDTYTENKSKLGAHKILYQAKDANGNTKQLEVTVNVVDNVPPVISGPSDIDWDYSFQAPTISQLQEYFTVTDNAGEISNKQIYIVENGLESFYPNVPLHYKVVLGVKDKAGNETTKTIYVHGKDLTPPVLEVKPELTLNLSDIPTYMEDILDMVVIKQVDNSGSTVLAYSFETTSGTLGYECDLLLKLESRDKSGNKTKGQSVIHIIDDIAPEFLVKTFLVETTVSKPISKDQMVKEIAKNLKRRNILYDQIEIISSDYSDKSEIGSYNVKYMYKYKDSLNYETLEINVVKDETPASNRMYLYALIGIPIVVGIAITIISRKRRKLLD